MELTTGILSSAAIVNIILIGTIMRIIGKVYLQIRSNISLGVMLFLGLLLIHNLIGATAFFLADEFISIDLLPYLIGITLSEAVALLVFLKIFLD